MRTLGQPLTHTRQRERRRLIVAGLILAVATVLAPASRTTPAGAAGPCEGHGGVVSAEARPDGRLVEVTLRCGDGTRQGPYEFEIRGPYPCADHGGVHSATARPGEGVVEVIIYCNDGTSEGPYVFELR